MRMVRATLPEREREIFGEVLRLGGLVKIIFEGRQVVRQTLFCLRREDEEALLSRLAATAMHSIRPIHPIHPIEPVHSIEPVRSIHITLSSSWWSFFYDDSGIASTES